MRSSPCAVAAVLAALGLSAWSQVDERAIAPVNPQPRTIYAPRPSPAYAPRASPAPRRPAIAARSIAPNASTAPNAAAAPRFGLPAPRPGVFAAASDSTATRMTNEAREERRFLRDAAAQSRFELDASRLAGSKSGNGGVRALGAALASHNDTIGLELAHLLHSRGMAMPMMTNDQRKVLNRLARLNGKKFDAFFMQRVGLAQAAVARDYQAASTAIHDPQINAWIARTLASTRYHQNLAERSMAADPALEKTNRSAIKSVRAAAGGRP